LPEYAYENWYQSTQMPTFLYCIYDLSIQGQDVRITHVDVMTQFTTSWRRRSDHPVFSSAIFLIYWYIVNYALPYGPVG
jgi:hypothetical protein